MPLRDGAFRYTDTLLTRVRYVRTRVSTAGSPSDQAAGVAVVVVGVAVSAAVVSAALAAVLGAALVVALVVAALVVAALEVSVLEVSVVLDVGVVEAPASAAGVGGISTSSIM